MQLIPSCPQLLKEAISKFMIVLNETEPQFIAESTIQQLRKTILELMQRIPANDQKSYSKDIIVSIYRLVEKENEENVLICFRLLIDYYRHLKPLLNNDVSEVSFFYPFLFNIQTAYKYRMHKNSSISLKQFTKSFPNISTQYSTTSHLFKFVI